MKRWTSLLLCAWVLWGCATTKPPPIATGWAFTIPGSAVVIVAPDRDRCESSRAAAATARLAAMSELTGMTSDQIVSAAAAMKSPLLLVGDCEPVAVTTVNPREPK